MGVSERRLLVTTALEESWGDDEEILFLGAWCTRYERRHVWSARLHRTFPFHWDDRAKLARDYSYLEGLHSRLLEALTTGLNELHGEDHGARYWRLILDPWLLSYLAAVFDRWESTRLVLEAEPGLEHIAFGAEVPGAPPRSYDEFLAQVFSDSWNQCLFEECLRAHSSGKLTFRSSQRAGAEDDGRPRSPLAPHRYPLKRAISAIRNRALHLCFPKRDVVFLGSTFDVDPLARLNLALGQSPTPVLGEIATARRSEELLPPVRVRREAPRINLPAETGFESFLLRRIARDLPTSAVEHYRRIQEAVRKIQIHPRVIVTGGNHWWDLTGKFWMAAEVERGARLVIAEHGGSLPPWREQFGFEDEVADVKATWFLPYHPRHRQLPPAKIVGTSGRPVTRASPGRFCSLIGSGCPRWVHRAQFYPMASQSQELFEYLVRFHEALDAAPRSEFRIKPYPGTEGLIPPERLVDVFGSASVIEGRTLLDVIGESKLVVCSYPETTFAETMASGAPTVLYFPERLYELHPVAAPLVKRLRSANILFGDPISAAEHVNRIWRDPREWWSSTAVVAVRDEFATRALDLQGDWVGKWRDFLQEISR